MTTNYNIFDYGGMIGPQSQARVDAFAKALRRTVTPDSIVLEIGAGVGFFSLLAAKLGARHVYAAEPNEAIHLARHLAKVNNCADRITFIQDLSTNITLPQQADIIISDIGGALPWYGEHIPSIVDARKRHLAPGGALLPQETSVYAAIASAPELHALHAAPWQRQIYGLDLQAGLAPATNHFRKARFKSSQLLSEPACVSTIHYKAVVNPDLKTEIRLPVKRSSTAHGACLWFDCVVCDGISFSNAPSQEPIAMYGQMFFPWPEPVSLETSDQASIILEARLPSENYVWSWRTNIFSHDGYKKAHFRQAKFPRLPIMAAA